MIERQLLFNSNSNSFKKGRITAFVNYSGVMCFCLSIIICILSMIRFRLINILNSLFRNLFKGKYSTSNIINEGSAVNTFECVKGVRENTQ